MASRGGAAAHCVGDGRNGRSREMVTIVNGQNGLSLMVGIGGKQKWFMQWDNKISTYLYLASKWF